MDQLPVIFGLQPELSEDGTYKKSDFNEAMDLLAQLIWHNGGFRFRKRREDASSLTASFFCAQDKAVFSRSSSTNVRDRSQMERFVCSSKLVLKPCFDERTLTLSLSHIYHTPYTDIHLTEEIHEFVESKSKSHSPSEIFRSIQDLKIPGYKLAVQSQIYYLWHKVSNKYWQRHENQFDSARLLLKEHSENYSYLDLKVDKEQTMRAVTYLLCLPNSMGLVFH